MQAFDKAKVFDCLNHEILLANLEHYGVRGNARKLLSSCLNNRIQYTVYDEKILSKF